MLEGLLAAAVLLAQLPRPEDAIDLAFADLDRRYFAMLTSTSDSLLAALADGPGEASTETSRCLGLLTPIQADLDTRPLRREMQLFARVVPEARSDVFEVARATARTQAANIQLRLRVLAAAEGNCTASSAYRMQRMRTMEVSEDVQKILSTVIGQQPGGSRPVN